MVVRKGRRHYRNAIRTHHVVFQGAIFTTLLKIREGARFKLHSGSAVELSNLQTKERIG